MITKAVNMLNMLHSAMHKSPERREITSPRKMNGQLTEKTKSSTMPFALELNNLTESHCSTEAFSLYVQVAFQNHMYIPSI